MVALGMAKTGLYTTPLLVLRKVWYQLMSAHTTTGFATVYSREFALSWPPLAVSGMVLAMLIGGSASSTAGGFKGLRVGILAKAVASEIRKMVSPSSAVIVSVFHHVRDVVLEDRHVLSAAIVVLLYVLTWFAGTAITTGYGYPFLDAAFETASVTGNVGLSIGITTPAMPDALKLVYLLIMWVGRLEFMSAFAILGLILKGVRRRWI
jgi:trk system potassium uptake protein TrkH